MGLFLAPKAYFYIPNDGTNVIKFKGPAKGAITDEWFEEQYVEPSRIKQAHGAVTTNFRIDWHTLNIIKKDTLVRLGMKIGSKRKPVYHGVLWVDTVPIEVTDLSCLNYAGKQIIKFDE